MENIHPEVSPPINTYIKGPRRYGYLFNAIDTASTLQWISGEKSTVAESLVAFVAVEGIFFSGSFASIFWPKKRRWVPDLFNDLCSGNTAWDDEARALLAWNLIDGIGVHCIDDGPPVLIAKLEATICRKPPAQVTLDQAHAIKGKRLI